MYVYFHAPCNLRQSSNESTAYESIDESFTSRIIAIERRSNIAYAIWMSAPQRWRKGDLRLYSAPRAFNWHRSLLHFRIRCVRPHRLYRDSPAVLAVSRATDGDVNLVKGGIAARYVDAFLVKQYIYVHSRLDFREMQPAASPVMTEAVR